MKSPTVNQHWNTVINGARGNVLKLMSRKNIAETCIANHDASSTAQSVRPIVVW
ncbi:hypothetical protein FP2506_12629 [Fulvimarina pelagi HTCC2506]|uniref:Uncharacterized protein n=1 Tax=Fulvimarina pelagi HTCC2506 TaxID=314231 RepID=Q0G1H0_9HYPH|nr:hypothetical protein FP2506_12629 [Fulvimarina pelagi HTCC2506]